MIQDQINCDGSKTDCSSHYEFNAEMPCVDIFGSNEDQQIQLNDQPDEDQIPMGASVRATPLHQ